MVEATVGIPVELLAVGADSGLEGTITVEIYDPTDGRSITEPSSLGITEIRSQVYRAVRTVNEIGTFAVHWEADGDTVADEELFVYAEPRVLQPVGTIPSVDSVGAILRARTQDHNDQELGTFTANTRPTAVAVQAILDQAASTIYGATGDLTDLSCMMADTIRVNAFNMVTLLAAMIVELSYFPEQVASGRSPYEQLRELFESQQAGMPALLQAVAECREGEVLPTPDQGGVGPGYASWSFPEDLGGLVGWGTRW